MGAEQQRRFTDGFPETVPAAAFECAAGEVQFGDNGDNAKTVPVRMVARSGRPIEHWYWGRVVHDLAGMHRHKSHLPIDYCHDDAEILGFLNKFERVTPAEGQPPDLVASGALVPFKDSDRVAEIIHKQRAGVPYEASIYFGGEGVAVEYLDSEATAEVNGYTLKGPAVIFRQWPLRGVAVCPYGADMHTSTNTRFGRADESFRVTILRREKEAMMADQKQTAEAPAKPAAVEATKQSGEAAPKAAAVEPAVKPAEAAPKAAVEAAAPPAPADPGKALDEARAEVKRFIEAFGPQGADWFAQGKSFAQAEALYVAQLKASNQDLQKRLEAVEKGAPAPVSARPEAAAASGPKAKDQHGPAVTEILGAIHFKG